MMPKTLPRRLRDWPLWRLLVALADAERDVGAQSETTRALAELVRERLGNEIVAAATATGAADDR